MSDKRNGEDAHQLLPAAFLLRRTQGTSIAYTYDRSGNRASMAVSGSGNYATTYTYDANNRLVTESKQAGDQTDIYQYAYDPNGNQIAKMQENLPDLVEMVENRYNGFNQLAGTCIGSEEISYVYSPSGLRLSKTVDSVKTGFVWDGLQTVLEMTDGVISASYLRGTNLISATRDGETNYYLHNAHADVVQLADAFGSVIKSYDYDAFGNERDTDADDPNPFRYCSEYFDKETGSIYLRARYYQPTTDRFLEEDTHWNPKNSIYGDTPTKWYERRAGEKDPLGVSNYTYMPDIVAISQSSNLYVYCINNPILYTDPSGNAVLAGAVTIGAGAATVAGGILAVGIGVAGGIVLGEALQEAANKTSASSVPSYPQKAKAFGSTPASPDPGKKPSLKNVDRKEAERLAKQQGYENAEAFKDAFVPGQGAKFNIKIDSITHEIILESIKGTILYSTGLFK